MSDDSAITTEQIAQDPLARQGAMRRLVCLVTDFYDAASWQRMAGIYDKNFHLRDDHSPFSRAEWVCRHAIHDVSDDTKAILAEYGLPYEKRIAGIDTRPDLIKELLDDWRTRADYFRISGAAYARGEPMSHDAVMAELKRAGHEAELSPLTPADITQEDLLGMMLFGGLHPDEAEKFLDWWQGENDLHDALCGQCEEWMGLCHELFPALHEMPTALYESINRGEIGYGEVRHKTELMQNLLLDVSNLQLDEKTNLKRLSPKIREMFKSMIEAPLCYNPNGTIKAPINGHPIIFAMEARENALAQHMMANGASAGFLSTPIVASVDAKHIADFVKTAIKHADYDTFKQVIEWLKAQGDDPFTIAAKNMNDHFSVSRDDHIVLFEEVIRSEHIPSILPKIDYLLGQALDPFVERDGALLLTPNFSSRIPNEGGQQIEEKADVVVGLLKRGFGQAGWRTDRGVELFRLPYDQPNGNINPNRINNEAAKDVIVPALLTMSQKVVGFINAYDKDPSRWPTGEVEPEEWLTPENITADDITEAFGFSEHVDLLQTPRWHGHEPRFCELFHQTPKHIQRELLADDRVNGYVKQLLATGMAAQSNQKHKPLASWSARIKSPEAASAHHAV